MECHITPFKFTKQWFLNLEKSSWVKNLNNMPDFDITRLKTYLIDSRNKTFDKDCIRAYKSLKAFKYFDCGYVQKISSQLHADNFVVQAEVLASMNANNYNIFVCLSNEGDVQGGSCDCVAGKGEACNHIAVLLFALEDYVAKGLKDLPEDKTRTEKLCQWNKPAKRKFEPKSVHNLTVVKQEYGKTVKERKTLGALNYDPRNAEDRTRDEDSYQQLCTALQTANPTCGFSKYNKCKTSTDSQKTDVSSKTCETTTDHDVFNHGHDSVNNLLIHPPSIDQIKSACSQYKDSMELSATERHELEIKTKSQSNSKAWHDARKHRITASNFHKIGFRRKADASNLLKSLLYGSVKPNKAMTFGLEQEDQAIQRFLIERKENGVSDVVVQKKGLVVHKHFSYLGASVDGLVKCGSDEYILELKNPYTTWDLTLLDAAKKLQCLKVDENQQISLNRKHAYYTQIQGQMAILDIHKCFFVLCTKENIHVEKVELDFEFWNVLLEKLQKFYNNILLPEIVYPSVKYGLPALDVSSL